MRHSPSTFYTFIVNNLRIAFDLAASLALSIPLSSVLVFFNNVFMTPAALECLCGGIPGSKVSFIKVSGLSDYSTVSLCSSLRLLTTC